MFHRLDWLRTWSLVADPRAWFLILVLAAATLGRSGLFRSRGFELFKPWKRGKRTARPSNPETARTHPLRDPWFLFLLVISAAAVASWIVMTMTAKGTNRP